jgi:hypothetical protein
MVNVQTLAAIDMWGSRGSLLRRRVIVCEFGLGVAGCCGLGTFVVSRSSGWFAALGVWLIAIGINYLPLLFYAIRLSRPGALSRVVSSLDLREELPRATRRQAWLLVPLAIVVFAVISRET